MIKELLRRPRSLFKRKRNSKIELRLNLNDMVVVTLTERGAEILNSTKKSYNHEYGLRLKCDYSPGEEYTLQLWGLFNLYGGYLSAGNSIVFENLRKRK